MRLCFMANCLVCARPMNAPNVNGTTICRLKEEKTLLTVVKQNRMDLLRPDLNQDTICFASVLHMMLVDVYDHFEARGAKPIVLYGTLSGAIRNGTTIPFTEDADVGYLDPTSPTTSSVTSSINNYTMESLRTEIQGQTSASTQSTIQFHFLKKEYVYEYLTSKRRDP